jgi:hypothetical protein
MVRSHKDIDINDLENYKKEILSKLKEIKNDKSNQDFKTLRKEYCRIYNKIRYDIDDDFRLKKCEYYHINK